MYKEILDKYFLLSKEKLSEFKDFLLTDKGQKIIAVLPLFFSWVPVLVYKFENLQIKRKCYQASVLTFGFIFVLLVSFFVSSLPFIGGVLANLLHLIGVLGYLSCSIFLVYSEMKEKNIEFQVLNKYFNSIEKLLN